MSNNHSRTYQSARLLLLAGLLLSILLLLAACGPRGGNPPAAEPAQPTVIPTEAAATEAPTEAAPTEAAPTEVAATETPAEEAATEETAATETPAEEAATGETAATETPAEEAAAEETAATETPAEEAATEAGPDPVVQGSEDPVVDVVAAQGQQAAGRVLAELGVNVRTGPGTNYPIIGIAPQGATGEIVGVSEDGQWWVADVPTAPNQQGWVAAAYVEATNADNVPVIPAPPLPEAAPLPAEKIAAPDELTTGSILFSASRVLREGNRAYDLEDIYEVAAAPGSAPTLIIQNAMQPAFQRGGDILAFRSTQPDQLGLSAYDFGTDQRVRYSAHLEDSRPSWSPTASPLGARLLFSSNRTGDRRWHLYLTPPTPSTDRTGFPEVTDLGFGKDGDWHPTSESIAFKGCDDTGNNCGLWTINADGSARAALTNSSNDSLPRWSPDGASIAFMSDSRDGNWELYVLSVADGAVTRLTNDPALDGLPTWSPDGRQIAFMSNRGDAWGIWIVAASGGEPQLVTQLEEQMPDWLLQGLDWPR